VDAKLRHLWAETRPAGQCGRPSQEDGLANGGGTSGEDPARQALTDPPPRSSSAIVVNDGDQGETSQVWERSRGEQQNQSAGHDWQNTACRSHRACGHVHGDRLLGPLLNTLPRVATISLAALIAEIGPLLERCEKPQAGRCPVRRRPGDQGTRQVPRRRLPLHANKPARVAITSFADNSRHRSAWAADI
jgi:hypothetical protein